METVSREALEQAQALFGAPTQDMQARKGESLDVEAYLNYYGREIVKVKQNGNATLYCLRECVFDPSHTFNESAIGITSEGKLFYQCFHNSCKGLEWKDAREKISGKDSLRQFIPGKENEASLSDSGKSDNSHKTSLTDRIKQVTHDTPFESIKEIIQDIAYLDTESEKAIHVQNLSEKTRIPKRELSHDVKKARKADSQPIDENTLIVHPSCEINQGFMSLGFKETVVIDNKPIERDFYIVAIDNGFRHTNEAVYQIGTQKLIFHKRDRVLISINDKWDKKRFLAFISDGFIPQGVYETIKGVLKEYIEFQNDAIYGLVTAWTIGTYFHRCFNAFPFLYFYGKKQTGKSRALDILERLSFHAFKNKGVSIPALADTIDGQRGTFLMDQAEILSQKNNIELLGILADSYTIGGGKRRIVNITNKSRNILEFETYGPKAFASIKEIDTDLKDRCIEIDMLRAEREYPYPEAFLPIWGEIRDQLYRLLLTRWKDIRAIYQNAGQGVIQRVRELWRPLDTVLIFEEVPDGERQAIRDFFLEAMVEGQAGLTELEETLINALLDLLAHNNEGTFTATEIVERMNVPETEKFKRDSQRKWTGRTLKKLSLYAIKLPKKDNRQHQYLFTRDRIQNIIHRYEVNGNNGNNGKNDDYQASTKSHLKNDNGNNGNLETDPNNLDAIPCHDAKTNGTQESLDYQGDCQEANKAIDSIDNGIIPFPEKDKQIKHVNQGTAKQTIPLEDSEAFKEYLDNYTKQGLPMPEALRLARIDYEADYGTWEQ